ncbi:MAG: hypothetical protein H6672_18510 [Anaerolineaceae bacterium]|nr:hypothetical protein [Anaerolineaceae bacterium]
MNSHHHPAPLYWKAILLLALLLPTLALRAQTDDSTLDGNPFGVVEGFWLPEVVCDLHPGWERIIFDWSQHQPTGLEDWNTLNVDERWLVAAQDCGREVVAIIKHTPAWATDGTPGPGVPRGLYLPVDDPGNTWAAFIRRTVEYYRWRGVNRFIIWNEPDITSDTYGFEFEGSLEDYFQMVKVAYLAGKPENPDLKIHLAGTTYWHDVNAGRRLYLDRLLERIVADPEAATNNYYFDTASLHIYFRTDTVYDIVRETRALLDSYGLTDKTIWINETNAGPTDDPLWPVVRPVYQLDLVQQSAFLVQAAGLGLAAGAERIAVYKFFDWNLPPGGETFGLLRADESRRPAFDAWGMVIRELSGVTRASFAQTDTVDVVRLAYTNGQTGILAWARTAAPASIQVTTGEAEATLFDQYGHAEQVTAQAGHYTLSLPAAQCNPTDGCAVGGAVSLLILPGDEITIQETTSGFTDLTFE